MLHKVHGSTPLISYLCFNLSYHSLFTDAQYSSSRPTLSLEIYDQKDFITNNPLPSCLPFIGDHCSTILPPSCDKRHYGTMDDVVEAMRRTTILATDDDGVSFIPPTTFDIQTYLTSTWPNKYPESTPPTAGWRNSVNQCLTHGQGWNFLTYPPIDGTKNKRHLLFERAFNGSCIVGPGQCKGLNDLKPNKQPPARKPANKANGSTTQSTSTPITPTSTPPTSPEDTGNNFFTISSPDWSLEWENYLSLNPESLATSISSESSGMQMDLDVVDSGLSVADIDTSFQATERSLEEVEAELRVMLGPFKEH